MLKRLLHKVFPPSATEVETRIARVLLDAEKPLTEAGVCRAADLNRYPDLALSLSLLYAWTRQGLLEREPAKYTATNYFHLTQRGRARAIDLAKKD
ncbi:hypothetical protein GCM10009801_73110 [Streptomyces albiaxialis]|uniref:Uncharacterized protein n=1 Tax=Streptomyces albiaxialis TaxID=329523 RepID=A0ABN2WXG4_9ACTN